MQTDQQKIVGTPDYMAPEVVEGKSHSKALDFWSIGIIAYEFITGALPFNDDSPELIFQNIREQIPISWPKIGHEEGEMTPEAHSLITQLLDYTPQSRLGANGLEELKKHPFFAAINWDTISEETAPFVPTNDDQDTVLFSKSAMFATRRAKRQEVLYMKKLQDD